MDGACLELTGKTARANSGAVQAEDEVLVRQAQQGDRAAFDALVRLYDQKVLRLALQIVRSPEEARDLYQEAFLKVYRSLPRFRFQSRFSTWLYRVVTNVCLDHLRRQNPHVEVQAPESEPGEPDYYETVADDRSGLRPDGALRAREIGGRIRGALALLTPRERVVFELRHHQGMRLRAIGDICGTTEETAKNCLFRATQKLRGALKDLV